MARGVEQDSIPVGHPSDEPIMDQLVDIVLEDALGHTRSTADLIEVQSWRPLDREENLRPSLLRLLRVLGLGDADGGRHRKRD